MHKSFERLLTNTSLWLATVVISSTLLSSALTIASGQQASSANSLSGTSWQLVKFQGPDERIFTPDDKSKYTIKFGSDGRVVARVEADVEETIITPQKFAFIF